MVAGPTAPAADSWVDNPNVGNFNPGKKAGQAIFRKEEKRSQGGEPPRSNKEGCSGHSSFLGK